MKRFIKFADGLLIVSFCLILFSVFSGTNQHKNIVNGGVLDFENISEGQAVPMNGSWEFYWGRQVASNGKIVNADNGQLVHVPSNWKRYRDAENKPYPVEGYAVYRIVVKAQKGRYLAVKMPQIGSSYRLWIDGKIRFESGKTGRNAGEAEPRWSTQMVSFQTQRENTEMLVEVSNFDYFRAGLTNAVTVGTQQQIKQLSDDSLFLDTFLFSSLFVMAVFFVLLYIVRFHNKSYISLALFAATVALRPLLYGECYFNKLFPNINFELNTKIYLVNFLMIQCFCLFFHYQYEELSSRKFMHVNAWLLFAIIMAGILLPARYMAYPVFMLEAMIPVAVFRCLLTLIRAFRKKCEGAEVNLISVLLLFFLSLVDVLKNNGLIAINLYYTPIAMLVVIFIQVFLQVGKFRESDRLNETLAHEVGIQNLKLEYEMKQRSVTEKLNSGLKAMVSTLETEDLLISIMDNLYRIIEFDSAVMMLCVDDHLSYIVTKLKNGPVICQKYFGKIILKDQKEPGVRRGYEKVRIRPLYIHGATGKNLIVKPLCYNEKLFSIIKMIVSKNKEVDSNDLELIDLYTEQSILALQNAKSYEKIKEIALYDELTGIYNRRQLMKLGMMEYISAKESGGGYYAMMLDIDLFKNINDAYGHLFGDKIIKNIADICRRCMPVNSVVGRYGGEEFLIFLKDMIENDVQATAEKLRKEIQTCSYSNGDQDHITVTVSIGIAKGGGDQISLYDLINNADKAMYQAKSAGRNCVRWFGQK